MQEPGTLGNWKEGSVAEGHLQWRKGREDGN